MTALCLLALAAVTSQDAMATPITLQYDAAPTRGCVQQLAEAAKVKLMVAEDLGREPIIVRVKDRPLRKVMDAMADALGGEWVERDGGWMLSIDRDLAKEEEEAARAEMRADIATFHGKAVAGIQEVDWAGEEGREILQKEVEKLVQLVDKVKSENPNLGPGGSISIMSGGATPNSPANNLLKKVLQGISVEQLDSIPWDGTVVFSDSPTPKQKRLTRSIGAAVGEFVHAHNLLANAAKKAKSGLPQGVDLRSASLDAKPIEGGILKVLVQIQRAEDGRGFTVEMKVADRAGKIVGAANTSIAAESKMRFPGEEEPDPEPKEIKDTLGLGDKARELVELPAASRELAAALSQSVAGGDMFKSVGKLSMGDGSGPPAKFVVIGETGEDSPLSKEARELAARPDRVDPLALAPGDLTAALANELGTDLVAVLPDKAATEAGKIILQGKVPYGRIAELFEKSDAVAEIRDGVLVVEPKSHVSARWTRMNRGALSRLTGDLYDKGFARMMDVAHYASNGHVQGTLDRAYLKLFTEDWDEALFGPASTRRLFRMMGHAWTSPEIQALNTPLLGMNSPLRREMEDLLYSTEMPTLFGGKGNFVAIGVRDGGGEEPEHSGPSLADEPTERYPNGLPAQSAFSIVPTPGKSVYVFNQQSGRGMFCSPMELVMRMQMFGPDGPKAPNYKADHYSYAVAQMTDVQVNVNIPNLGPQSEYFKDGKLDTAAPRVTYGRLPADIADEIKKLEEQMGQRGGGIRFGGPGGGKTPPPGP